MRGLLILLLLLPNVVYSAPNALIPQEYKAIDQEENLIPIGNVIEMRGVRERLLHDIDFKRMGLEPFEYLKAYKVQESIIVVYAPFAEVGTYFVISTKERTVIGTLYGNRLYGLSNKASLQFCTIFDHGGGSNLEEYGFYTREGRDLEERYSILIEGASTDIPSGTNVKDSVETIDKCTLRMSPEILDTPNIGSEDQFMCRTNGNIVVEYPKGSKGQALFKKHSDAGRVWYFVIMEPNERAESCYFYYPELKIKSFAGWMSEDCIHITKD